MNALLNKKRTVIISPPYQDIYAIRNVPASILSGKGKILFVEGNTDFKFYSLITKSLNKTITIVSLYNKQYLSDLDTQLIVGKYGKNSTKRTIILLVKRLYATELIYPSWYQRHGAEHKEVYGIVDRDFDFNDDDIKYVGSNISPTTRIEKVIKNIGNGVTIINKRLETSTQQTINSRLTSTKETCDVESLIFCYDPNAIINICPESIAANEWKMNIKNTKQKVSALGFIRCKSESNYHNGNAPLFLDSFLTQEPEVYSEYIASSLPAHKAMEDLMCYYCVRQQWSKIIATVNYWTKNIPKKIDWNYCKGHDLEDILTDLANMKHINFKKEEYDLINSVMQYINVTNFQNTNVYRFISNI